MKRSHRVVTVPVDQTTLETRGRPGKLNEASRRLFGRISEISSKNERDAAFKAVFDRYPNLVASVDGCYAKVVKGDKTGLDGLESLINMNFDSLDELTVISRRILERIGDDYPDYNLPASVVAITAVIMESMLNPEDFNPPEESQ